MGLFVTQVLQLEANAVADGNQGWLADVWEFPFEQPEVGAPEFLVLNLVELGLVDHLGVEVAGPVEECDLLALLFGEAVIVPQQFLGDLLFDDLTVLERHCTC